VEGARRHGDEAVGEPASSGTARLLENWALEAGFDRAGVVALAAAAGGEALQRWLSNGHAAGMSWMGRRVERRLDPRRLLPGASSALCVALHYWPLRGGPEAPAENDLWQGVARYARGEDYHGLMGARLERLEERIRRAFPACRTRRYVDTGPILERELAAAAGLGRVGKNTNLLHRRSGSWFLLGEILLTLDPHELGVGEAADGITDVCGRCTRCLDACPTGALPEPFVLDARRCISYWTIEHRGSIPEAMRPGLGEWVFGCDVCQEVCPWNGEVEGGEHAELALPSERRSVDLVGLLLLERDEYVERFRGSPMKRAKLEGLQRNAAVAMGNRGDARYVPALLRALGSAAPEVRSHAAWALGRIGGPAAGEGLAAAHEREEDGEVRRELEGALASCGGGGSRPSR